MHQLVARLLDHRADQGDQRHGGDRAAGQAERRRISERRGRPVSSSPTDRASPRSSACPLRSDGSSCRSWIDLLLGHQPLGPEHQPDAHEQQHRSRSRPPSSGGVEAEVLRRAGQVPVVGQRDERDDEADAARARRAGSERRRRARRASRPWCRRIGNRSRRWTMWTPSASAPAIIASSGVISRSSSAVGRSCRVGVGCAHVRRHVSVVAHCDFAPIHRMAIISAPTPADPDHDRLGHRADPVDAAAARVLRTP